MGQICRTVTDVLDTSRFLSHSNARLSYLRPRNDQNAPLFYSAADELNNRALEGHSDDAYTLQSSRRQPFMGSDDSVSDVTGSHDNHHAELDSSWRPDRAGSVDQSQTDELEQSATGVLQTIWLGRSQKQPAAPSQYHETDNDTESESGGSDLPPDDIALEQSRPFRVKPSAGGQASNRMVRQENEHDAQEVHEVHFHNCEFINLVQPTLDANPRHDHAWFVIYNFCLVVMLSLAFVVFLKTDAQSKSADSLYALLHHSFRLVWRDGLLALTAAAIWVVLVRFCTRPLTYLIVFMVPVVGSSLAIYSLVMSHKGNYAASAVQNRVMALASTVPFGFCMAWSWFAWRRRRSLARAISMIELSCKIINENPGVIIMSLAVLASFSLLSSLWVRLFARNFLYGRSESSNGIVKWVVQSNAWALGAYFVFMYLWSWSVLSSLQRCATAAVVSQWYYHRLSSPSASHWTVMKASIQHATDVMVGTCCLSGFVSLTSRVPLVFLPRGFAMFAQSLFYLFTAGPIFQLSSPLTLCVAAIHSVPLVAASNSSSRIHLLDPSNRWSAYRFSKMILIALRAFTALGMGFSGWVAGRHEGGAAGAYGYMVGLIVAAVGWFIVGAIEGQLSMTLDSLFVCYAVDLHQSPDSDGGHCREAWQVFGQGE